jgi:predicted GTPase
MSSLPEGAQHLLAVGPDIGARLNGLAQAAEAAEGRLDDELVGEARGIAERAGRRLKLSSEHTVVGIAGATGSGKSSTFNALTGLELSAVGVRRPTTSWATACVWGANGARELLEWLGIPDRHQTTRDSMLDTRRESNELDGVVLLDLPDHDSTEVAHHLEVDRLVSLADMLVWVLDPQKYADAAIHDRYLEPLRTHDEVMVVVLNHIDRVPEERRQSMLDDVRRLLDDDGLQKVPVIAVSARLGWGIAELKAEIAKRVSDKRATKGRLEADVKTLATRMGQVSGDAAPKRLEESRIEALDTAVAEAAGVPAIVDAVERSTRQRAGRATGWPLVSWASALKPDPLKRLQLELGAEGQILAGRSRTALPEASSVQRPRVDSEVRALADETGSGLGTPWREAVRRASVSHIDELNERLDAALGQVDLGASRLPGWASAVRVVQWLLAIAAAAGLVWTVLLAASGTLSRDDTPKVAGIAMPVAILVGALVLGIVLALACRVLVASAAKSRAASADARLRGAVAELTHELVAAPIQGELAAYARFREGLAQALK